LIDALAHAYRVDVPGIVRAEVDVIRGFLKTHYADTAAEARIRINAALDVVAKHLGNTRTVCRKYYVHPDVMVAYESRTLTALAETTKATRALAYEERVVIRLLSKGSKRTK
jgi:DNA topoisomerase-1